MTQPLNHHGIVEQFINEFWNRADVQAAERWLSADYVDHAYQPADRSGLQQTLAAINSSFPDHRWSIESSTAEGDLVVVRMRMQATHQGDFRGTPASGNPIDVSAYRTFRISNGQIAEHWALLDTATLLRQIGSAPTPQNACAR